MWGQLRDPVQKEKSPLITRYGGAMCNYTNTYPGSDSTWNECLNTTVYSNYAEFVSCFFNNVHAPAHVFVGGSHQPDVSKEISVGKKKESWETASVNVSSCISWIGVVDVGNTSSGNIAVQHYAQPYYDCLFCPKCDISDPSHECESCHLIDKEGECEIIQDGVTYTTNMNSAFNEYVMGDFYDVATSFNDPFFFLHHINMDRYSYIWQLINYEKRPYYDFPVKGYGYGLNLMDISNYLHPFKDVFEVFDSERELTHKDIFDATTLEYVPYLYPDIVDAIETQLLLNQQEIEKEKEMFALKQQRVLQKQQRQQKLYREALCYVLIPIICIVFYFVVGKFLSMMKHNQFGEEMNYEYAALV